MENDIKFEGPGPFHLPVAQTTAVEANKGNGVTMILNCMLPDRGGHPEAVNVQMLSKVARELAAQLNRAADEVGDKR